MASPSRRRALLPWLRGALLVALTVSTATGFGQPAASPPVSSPPVSSPPAGAPAQSQAPSAAPQAAPAGRAHSLKSIEAASRRLTDAPASLWEHLAAGRYAEALPLLLALESRWAMDPLYNSLLAETALAARRYGEATLALERLVLLEPRNAGAWLDLAVASEAMGDADTARRALDTLEREFTVPPGIRLVMLSLRGKLAASTAAPARLRFRAALLFGYDSNANGGLAVNSIVLTPPEGSIELPVDQAFLPRPSNLWLGSVDATGRWQTGWGPVEARLRLSGKRYSSEPNYDTNDVAVTVAGSIANSDQAFWVAEWRRLNMGNSLLVLDIPRLWAVRDLPVEVAGFQPSLGVELEGRRYQDALSIYDARILWLVAGVRRTLWGGFLNPPPAEE